MSSKKNFKSGFDGLIGDEKSPSDEVTNNTKSKKDKMYTFLIDVDQLEKVKAVAFWDRKTIKDVLFEAIQDYISNYEKDKGQIKTISR